MISDEQKKLWQIEAINMQFNQGIMSLDSLSAEELYTKWKLIRNIRRTLLGLSVILVTAVLLILINIFYSIFPVFSIVPIFLLGIVSCVTPLFWFNKYFRATDVEKYVKLLSPYEISKFNGWAHDLSICDSSAIEIDKPSLLEIMIMIIMLLIIDLLFII